MKILLLPFSLLISFFAINNSMAQDIALNIATPNSGNVNVGAVILLQADVSNVDGSVTLPANRARVQITVPSGGICTIAASGHVLASGWTIETQTATSIRIRSTSSTIAPGTTQTSYIAIQSGSVGNVIAQGQLSFPLGAPTSPPNNTANDVSSAPVNVINPVPVVLSEFSAAVINCEPLLKWVTENEVNSKQFEIEKSLNGSTWAITGNVAAAVNSDKKTNYSFTDNNTTSPSKILYRLKMIDQNGSYKYSYVLPVYLNCKEIKTFIYPNPVKSGKLVISRTGSVGKAMCSLATTTGQLIFKATITTGTNYLNVSNLPAGIYILEIKQPGIKSITEKIIIQGN